MCVSGVAREARAKWIVPSNEERGRGRRLSEESCEADLVGADEKVDAAEEVDG